MSKFTQDSIAFKNQRVWIEFERPKSFEHSQHLTKQINNMLKRLGVTDRSIWWSANAGYAGCWCYGSPESGFVELVDNGQWFSLDFFGRE